MRHLVSPDNPYSRVRGMPTSHDSPRILCPALALLAVVTITFASRDSVETVVAAVALAAQQLLPNIPVAVVPNK